MCASYPFGFEGGMWDLIILVADHCLSFYFLWLFDVCCICFSVHSCACCYGVPLHNGAATVPRVGWPL